MGRNSDDLPTNSMASSDSCNVLEKGTILSFGSWIYVADGSGGFASHLVDPESIEPSLNNEALVPNNSATQVANTENTPEESQGEENFDLIKRYWTDPEAMPHPRVDNSDLLDGIDHVSAELAECINLAQTTLDEYGVPYFKNRPVTRSHNPQSDDIFAHLDRVDNTLLDCIKLAENTLNA